MFHTSLLGACVGHKTPHPDSNETRSPNRKKTLTTADGVAITYRSARCIYRQSTGADDTLSLQIQYLDAANALAFAVYIDDPKPARPFRATPGEVSAWNLEVYSDGTRYSTALHRAELTVRLDALPAPSQLEAGETIRLHGALDISAFSVPRTSEPGEKPSASLQLAAGSLPIDCEADYQESAVVN